MGKRKLELLTQVLPDGYLCFTSIDFEALASLLHDVHLIYISTSIHWLN